MRCQNDFLESFLEDHQSFQQRFKKLRLKIVYSTAFHLMVKGPKSFPIYNTILTFKKLRSIP